MLTICGYSRLAYSPLNFTTCLSFYFSLNKHLMTEVLIIHISYYRIQVSYQGVLNIVRQFVCHGDFVHKYSYYFFFKFSGHVVSNCVRQVQFDAPNESCHLDSFASAHQSTCETTCKDRTLCQMYYFTGSVCSLYNCQESRFDDKSGQHLIYYCTTGNS